MKYILFSFLFIGMASYAQRTIKGRVVNENTGAGVPGSSVFISGSSRGTVSNESGFFELTDIPSGKHELIISSVGYETNVYSFTETQLPLQVKVMLAIKVKELDNVTLEPSVEEGWDKWGRVFTENFIGRTDNALQCRIKNEKAIRFRHYKKSNRLVAYSDEPVMVENKALGYIVRFQMENFELNFNDRSISYIGYPLYEPIESDRKNQQQKWEKNRRAAYHGSVMHFMRSLYNNRLMEEGFEVRRMVRTFNEEKQRVKNIYRTVVVQKIDLQNGKLQGESSNRPKITPDSMRYYESVMRQKDYVERYGTVVLSADSLIIEKVGEFKTLHFDDYLFVTFLNEKEEADYLKTQLPPRPADFQRSYVTLLNDKFIVLDKNGNYYSPRDFFTSAYWGWSEKMANSLPLDYKTNDEK